MMAIRELRDSGFDIKELDLSMEDWKALVIIDRYIEIKKLSTPKL